MSLSVARKVAQHDEEQYLSSKEKLHLSSLFSSHIKLWLAIVLIGAQALPPFNTLRNTPRREWRRRQFDAIRI